MNDALKYALELAAVAQHAHHDQEVAMAALIQAYASVAIAQSLAEIAGDISAIRQSMYLLVDTVQKMDR